MRSFSLKATLFFLFIFAGEKAMAQDYNHDSLKRVAQNEKNHDTIRLFAMGSILENNYMNHEKTVFYTNEIGKMATLGMKKSKKGSKLYKTYAAYMSVYYNNQSVFIQNVNDPRGFIYMDKAMRYSREAGNEQDYYYLLINKGTMYAKLNKFKQAQKCYFRALYFFEVINKKDNFGIAFAYINIATLHNWQNDYRTSIFYLKKALRYLNKDSIENMDYTIQKITCLTNIGSDYIFLEDYKKSRKYLKEALWISKKNGLDYFLGMLYSKIGRTYQYEKNQEEAFRYFQKGYELSTDETALSYTAVNLGQAYLARKDYNKALELGNEGLKNSEATDKDLRESAYNLLYKANKEVGQYQLAMEYLEKAKTLGDSINSVENTKELKNQKAKYLYEKKAIQLKLDAAQKNAAKNKLLFGLVTVLLVVLFGGSFLYVLYRNRARTITYEKNELNQRLLRSQMNPHFLFNSLNAIYNYMDKNQAEEAGNYLTSFAKLVRSILENSREETVILSKELSWLQNYMKLQQLRFETPFNYTIDVDPEIAAELTLVPPMLVQPFVENAIEHGFSADRETNSLNVSYRKNGDMLEIVVSDTGSGFQEKNMENKQQKSLALSITEERLRLLTSKYKKKANFRIESQPEKGTRIFFSVPFQTLA